MIDTTDIIGNKHKVQKEARSNKEIDVFQGKIADFSRYLGFSQAIELFPIMSNVKREIAIASIAVPIEQ